MEAKSQAQETEDSLRRLIFDMEIGPGERLTERWVETQLNTSRTSVRTALFRLESEGMVAREGRGWIVPPINPDEIRQLFVYREILEAAAIELFEPDACAEMLVELEANVSLSETESDPEAYDQAGFLFHILIARLSRNEYIVKGVADAMTRLRRVRWIENMPSSRGWREHQEIVEALSRGAKADAMTLMRRHTRDTAKRVLSNVEAMRMTLRARGIKVAR